MPAFRSYAIVPAAGASARMGQPKLLLPWCEATIIETVLDAWRAAGVRAMVVVVPPGDRDLADLCWHAGAEVVTPERPPADMKQSVQLALRHIARHLRPRETDAWLLAPADMPRLSPAIARRLMERHQPDEPGILLPTLGGRRGHPVLFPWPLAASVSQLGPSEGVNRLVERKGAVEVACDDIAGADAFGDVDTPDDYAEERE